jgi:hypothetical protein
VQPIIFGTGKFRGIPAIQVIVSTVGFMAKVHYLLHDRTASGCKCIHNWRRIAAEEFRISAISRFDVHWLEGQAWPAKD